MKKMLLLFLVVVLSTPAFALTLKEKKQLVAWKTELADPANISAKEVMKKCGIAVPATVSEDMVTPYMEMHHSATSPCETARSTIAGMCKDPTSKQAIVSQVKKITCKNGPAKDKLVINLSGGNLELAVGPDSANVGDKVKEYLENNLK